MRNQTMVPRQLEHQITQEIVALFHLVLLKALTIDLTIAKDDTKVHSKKKLHSSN